MFVSLQLTLDGADRLVAALERRGGAIGVVEAAALLLAAPRVPPRLAEGIVGDLVAGDGRLTLVSRLEVALAAASPTQVLLEEATFCVVDLETTGTRAAADRIVEVGAVRIEALEIQASFERLVDPGVPLPLAVQALTGIAPSALRGRIGIGPVLDELLAFSGDAVLVAHNARFDCAFLDAELLRTGGARLACPVLDTVLLARRLLPPAGSVALGALADRLGTNVRPTHRALPDAQATAEILLMLLGEARRRGAGTLSDLLRIGGPPAHAARLHAAVGGRAGRTVAPGAVTFEHRLDLAAAPGRGRSGGRPAFWIELTEKPVPRLRATRSRAAAGLVAGPVGSAAEARAAADALRTAHGLRTCDAAAPAEGSCLEGRLGRCSAPCRGPAERSRHAHGAASARAMLEGRAPLGIGRLRARRDALARELRFEEAARLRDGEAALRRAAATLRAVREARRRHGIVLAPHLEPGLLAAFVVAYGLVVDRAVVAREDPGADRGPLEVLWRAVRAGPGPFGPFAVAPEREREALLVASTFRRPPDDVRVVPLSPPAAPAEPDERWLREARARLAGALERLPARAA